MEVQATKSKIFLQSLVIATVAEFIGLFYWVDFVDKGNLAFGIVILVLGLLAERISVYMLIHAVWGENPPHKNLIFNLVIAGIGESLAWLLWLVLADKAIGLFWASAVMAVLLLIEHSIQIGFFMQRSYLSHVKNPTTILFSIIEAVVGYYWLHFVRHEHVIWGAIILFVGLTVEHIIQGSVIGDKPPSQNCDTN